MAEASFRNAKEQYDQAATAAIDAKQEAKKRYENEKKAGSVHWLDYQEEGKPNQQLDIRKEYELENKYFEYWVQQNEPALLVTYMEYNRLLEQFLEDFRHYDRVKAEEWREKHQDLWSQWRHGYFDNGKDKGSKFIIITSEDVENYDYIKVEQERQAEERREMERALSSY